MAEFFTARDIKATRKNQTCESCGQVIAVGSPAIYSAAKEDGEFFAWHAHPECRAAEIAWNEKADQWGEDFCWLSQIREADDRDDWFAWLREHHPVAAARVLPELVQ